MGLTSPFYKWKDWATKCLRVTLSHCPWLWGSRVPIQVACLLSTHSHLLNKKASCAYFIQNNEPKALALLPCLLSLSLSISLSFSLDHRMRSVFVFFSREAESEPSFFPNLFFQSHLPLSGSPKDTNSQDSPLMSFPLCLPLSLCSAVNSQDTNYHGSLQLAWGEAAGL